jgi:hypothetical protein
LSNRLAFPLLLARSVRELVPTPPPSSLLSGEVLTFTPSLRADAIEVSGPDGSVRRIALDAQYNALFAAESHGVYRISELAGETALYETQLPVNAGAARESALRPQPLPETAVLGAANKETAITAQRSVWPWLAALALMIVVLEWLYVHRGTGRAAAQKAAP